MITIILKSKSGEELGKVGQPGNEVFLRQEGEKFPILSELSQYSPDIFGAADVPELLSELELIQKSMVDPLLINQVREILDLVGRAARDNDAVLLFTPFDKEVRRGT